MFFSDLFSQKGVQKLYCVIILDLGSFESFSFKQKRKQNNVFERNKNRNKNSFRQQNIEKTRKSLALCIDVSFSEIGSADFQFFQELNVFTLLWLPFFWVCLQRSKRRKYERNQHRSGFFFCILAGKGNIKKKKDEQQQTRLYSNRSNLFQNLTCMMYFDAFNQLWRCMETILQSPPPAPKIY